MPKVDPCQKQACDIQTCLQANKYIEEKCQSAIAAMVRCCEKRQPGESICCSGFMKKREKVKSKTS